MKEPFYMITERIKQLESSGIDHTLIQIYMYPLSNDEL